MTPREELLALHDAEVRKRHAIMGAVQIAATVACVWAAIWRPAALMSEVSMFVLNAVMWALNAWTWRRARDATDRRWR